MTLYTDRLTRWLIERPQHLLGWWLFLALLSLLGVVLALVVMPVYYLPAFIVPTWLQLGVDLRYIPPRSARVVPVKGGGAGPMAPESSPRNASHPGASR